MKTGFFGARTLRDALTGSSRPTPPKLRSGFPLRPGGYGGQDGGQAG